MKEITIDPKSPKHVIAGAMLVIGAIGGGSLMGLTIEPENTTELRIQSAKMEEQLKACKVTEEKLKTCELTSATLQKPKKGKGQQKQ